MSKTHLVRSLVDLEELKSRGPVPCGIDPIQCSQGAQTSASSERQPGSQPGPAVLLLESACVPNPSSALAVFRRMPAVPSTPCDWHGCPIGAAASSTGRVKYADFRCPLPETMRRVRDYYQVHAMYFHRVVDCLLPLLPLLHHIVEQQKRGRRPIALAQADSVAPLLRALEPSLRIHEVGMPRGKYRYPLDAHNATLLQQPSCCLKSPTGRELLQRFTSRWFGGHAQPPSSRPRLTIIIQRSTAFSRGFEAGSLDRLVAAMRAARPLTRIYSGAEPLAEVLKLFADAESVVGYHGAAFANMAFSRLACAHEVTTMACLRTDASDLSTRMFRTAEQAYFGSWVERFKAGVIKYNAHALPLAQLLENPANDPINARWWKGAGDWRRVPADKPFIGQLGYSNITLTSRQVEALVEGVLACTASWGVTSGRRTAASTHTRSLLLDSRVTAPSVLHCAYQCTCNQPPTWRANDTFRDLWCRVGKCLVVC